MTAKRILVVEDEPNIAESLTFLLGRAGFEVSVETDGNAGLDAALSQIPDAVILDVMLPGLDGYDVLRKLRADDRSAEMPVIVLSAKGQREDRESAIACGADLFISKPFSNEEIVAAVRRLAGGRGT
jgi:DNA-binding response OmpR family regulator